MPTGMAAQRTLALLHKHGYAARLAPTGEGVLEALAAPPDGLDRGVERAPWPSLPEDCAPPAAHVVAASQRAHLRWLRSVQACAWPQERASGR